MPPGSHLLLLHEPAGCRVHIKQRCAGTTEPWGGSIDWILPTVGILRSHEELASGRRRVNSGHLLRLACDVTILELLGAHDLLGLAYDVTILKLLGTHDFLGLACDVTILKLLGAQDLLRLAYEVTLLEWLGAHDLLRLACDDTSLELLAAVWTNVYHAGSSGILPEREHRRKERNEVGAGEGEDGGVQQRILLEGQMRAQSLVACRT